MNVIRFPVAHGSGGFAIRHETKTANQLAREHGQLRGWDGDSFRNAVVDISAFRYRNPFIKLWFNCGYLYWRFSIAFLRAAASI